MTETIDYYIKKTQGLVKNSKKGLTSLELCRKLGFKSVSSWDKYRQFLKDIDAIYYDPIEQRWMWTG